MEILSLILQPLFRKHSHQGMVSWARQRSVKVPESGLHNSSPHSLGLQTSCFALQHQNQRDIDHFVQTNEVWVNYLSEYREWKHRQDSTLHRQEDNVWHLCTRRELPMLASLLQALAVAGFNPFIWGPWRHNNGKNYSPTKPVTDQ